MVMQTKQSLYILLSVDADRLQSFSKHDRFQKENYSVKLNWTSLFDITVLKASYLECQNTSMHKECVCVSSNDKYTVC